jgi:hypothetical protein
MSQNDKFYNWSVALQLDLLEMFLFNFTIQRTNFKANFETKFSFLKILTWFLNIYLKTVWHLSNRK